VIGIEPGGTRTRSATRNTSGCTGSAPAPTGRAITDSATTKRCACSTSRHAASARAAAQGRARAPPRVRLVVAGRKVCLCAVSTMKLCIIGVPARCAKHQSTSTFARLTRHRIGTKVITRRLQVNRELFICLGSPPLDQFHKHPALERRDYFSSPKVAADRIYKRMSYPQKQAARDGP
jgi:hypothetical protein